MMTIAIERPQKTKSAQIREKLGYPVEVQVCTQISFGIGKAVTENFCKITIL
ncbi:hypothetical protein H6G32_03540 [Cylindrospermum sp. FACHB-282]|nr:hypothetical protein [Cylindrospermum sp. FACHB-282]